MDDEFEITNVLKELLQDCNYDVDVAFDGIQALGKIREKNYDAILCDYLMPRMNGQVLYETLLKSHLEIASRFIFVTVNARIPEVSQFFDTFRIPHLEKPFRTADVIHLVERVLQASTN